MSLVICGTRTTACAPGFSSGGKGVHFLTLCVDDWQSPKQVTLNALQCTLPLTDPSFVYVLPKEKCFYLYAVQETQPNNKAGIVAYELSCGTNGEIKLKKLGECDTKGTFACHITHVEDILFVSNYLSGSVHTYKIGNDGALTPVDFVQLEHHSNVVPERQEGPHAHSCLFIEATRKVYIADLGADRVYAFEMMSNGSLKPDTKQPIPFIEFPHGSGPRHTVKHRKLDNIIYVSCELSHEVCAVNLYNGGKIIQRESTLFQHVKAYDTKFPQTVSHVDISPCGNFLYVANRGPQSSIAAFRIDQTNGLLTQIGVYHAGALVPRHLTMKGNLMLVANQEGEAISAFRIEHNGALTHLSNTPQGTPQCLVIL